MDKKFAVTKALLESIVNNRYFIEGLKVAGRLTSETGNETKFDVSKKVLSDRIIMDNYIIIGTNSAAIDPDEKIMHAIKAYKRATGKTAKNDNNHYTNDFNSFINQENFISLDFPAPKSESVLGNLGILHELYPIFSLHTHPKNSSLLPSFRDLNCMNELRKHPDLLWRKYSEQGFYPRVIEIIAKPDEKNADIELLFIQENSDRPLKFFDRLMMNFCTEIEVWRKSIFSSNGNYKLYSPGCYNVGFGRYDVRNEKIRLYFNLKKFEFVEEFSL